MKLLSQIKFLMDITRTHDIVRRYFVVNGFDGALTMLGLLTGFLLSSTPSLTLVINACLGAAIALGVSGVSSAYVSETAERRRELSELEDAMITDLRQSSHAEAARWVPMLIALVNGAAPFLISLIIVTPLWLANQGYALPFAPLYLSIGVSFVLIFFLGVFTGRISGASWLMSGFKTLLVSLVTIALIYLFTGG